MSAWVADRFPNLFRHLAVLRASWGVQNEADRRKRPISDHEFLPAALEIMEKPPSPGMRMLLLMTCAFFSAALIWSGLMAWDEKTFDVPMVSLAAIETMVAKVWPDQNHVVVALPDARKGEQLVLVTETPNADRAALQEAAKQQGFPELWVPRAILVTQAIPVLGNGKIDYGSTRELAASRRSLL